MPDVPRDEREAMIHDLAGDGMGPTAISQEVFGYKNARTVERVRAVLDSDK